MDITDWRWASVSWNSSTDVSEEVCRLEEVMVTPPESVRDSRMLNFEGTAAETSMVSVNVTVNTPVPSSRAGGELVERAGRPVSAVVAKSCSAASDSLPARSDTAPESKYRYGSAMAMTACRCSSVRINEASSDATASASAALSVMPPEACSAPSRMWNLSGDTCEFMFSVKTTNRSPVPSRSSVPEATSAGFVVSRVIGTVAAASALSDVSSMLPSRYSTVMLGLFGFKRSPLRPSSAVDAAVSVSMLDMDVTVRELASSPPIVHPNGAVPWLASRTSSEKVTSTVFADVAIADMTVGAMPSPTAGFCGEVRALAGGADGYVRYADTKERPDVFSSALSVTAPEPEPGSLLMSVPSSR